MLLHWCCWLLVLVHVLLALLVHVPVVSGGVAGSAGSGSAGTCAAGVACFAGPGSAGAWAAGVACFAGAAGGAPAFELPHLCAFPQPMRCASNNFYMFLKLC